MHVIFNGNLNTQENIPFPINNRAFAYGDGIFETMVVRRGTCPLLKYHYSRLLTGLQVLEMEVPFRMEDLEAYVWELSTKHSNPLLRMRLQLWRKPGGLYAPQFKDGDFLISASEFKRPIWHKEIAGFSKTVQLSPSPFSHLKTMSTLPYVLAGIEMKKRQLDEIILTDTKGNVAEAGSSNLFWLMNNKWQTPHLKSGCIAGVMRAYLLDQLREKQIEVEEVLLPKERLKEADVLVSCNATGVYTIKNLDFHTFENGREFLTQFIQLPEL